jgi:hypothetical protein
MGGTYDVLGNMEQNPEIQPTQHTTMSYTIEDNVPLPACRQGLKGGYSGTVRSLKPGQSFFCGDKPRSSIQSQTWAIAKKTGAKFSVCKEGEGFRVFRVS